MEVVLRKRFNIETQYKRSPKKNEAGQKPYGFPNLVAKTRNLKGALPLKLSSGTEFPLTRDEAISKHVTDPEGGRDLNAI
jgi:hypothetical protein